MTISSRLTNALYKLTKTISEDATKTENGNKSAGTRVRKAMQEIIRECKEVRKEVLELRNKE